DAPLPADHEFECAFYGELFRKAGTRVAGYPPLDAADVQDEWEIHMLLELWTQAAVQQPGIMTRPEDKTRVATPQIVQRALYNLSKSQFFSGLAERALIWNLRQVRQYLSDDSLRQQIQTLTGLVIGPDTRVVIGHSLGSIVAYEFLCAHPELEVKTFVTLGSPLGIRHLVFERLRPPPVDHRGIWPNVSYWFNIASGGDVVALEKKLASVFGERVKDVPINNETRAHDVTAYLTARETGAAIASGLN